MDDLEIALYKIFHDFIKNCRSSEDIRLLDSNVPLPNGPFMGVKVDTITPVSWATGERTDPTGTSGLVAYSSTYVGTLLLIAYGDAALTRLQSVAVGLREKNTRAPLSDNGVAYVRSSPVVDISSAVDGTKIEKRATMTIDFNFVQGGDDRGGGSSVIETVTTPSGTYNDPC